jgi:diguanylate cyclase (GGDEF)-like protein
MFWKPKCERRFDMLLSEATYYITPAVTLVTGLLGGWVLRNQFGGQTSGTACSRPPRRKFARRRSDCTTTAAPACSNTDHIAAQRHPVAGKGVPCVRNTFALALDRCLPDAARRGEPLSVLLVSIDNARGLGGGCGLRIDNETLEAVGKTFIAEVRTTDWVARFDATTFALLLPGAVEAGAMIVAQRLRKTISNAAADGVTALPLTLSIGVAEFVPGDSSATILERAEEAMFAAVAAGGDCVRSQSAEQTSPAALVCSA